MNFDVEFVTRSSTELSDIYRITFEGEIQPAIRNFLSTDLWKQVQPNIFEAPISEVQQFLTKLSSDLSEIDKSTFPIFFAMFANKAKQEVFRLEVVSSVSKAD